MNKTKKPEGVI